MASSTPSPDNNGKVPLKNMADGTTGESTASTSAFRASSNDTKGCADVRGLADRFDPQELRILRTYGSLQDNVDFYKRLQLVGWFGNGPLYKDHFTEFIKNYALPSRCTDRDKGSVIKLDRVLQVLKENSYLKDGPDLPRVNLFKDNHLLKDIPDMLEWGRKECEARFFVRTFYANKQNEEGVFFGTGEGDITLETEMRKLWIVLLVRKYHWYGENPKTTPKQASKPKTAQLHTFRQPTALQLARRKSSGPNVFGGQLAVTWVCEGNRTIRSMLVNQIEYKEWEEAIGEICEGFGFVTDKALNNKEIMVAETAYDIRKRHPDDEMPDWSRLTEEHPQMTRGGWTKLRKCGAESRRPIFVVIYSIENSQSCTDLTAPTSTTACANTTAGTSTAANTKTTANTNIAAGTCKTAVWVREKEWRRRAIRKEKQRKKRGLANGAGEAAGALNGNISDDEEKKVDPKNSEIVVSDGPGPSKRICIDDARHGDTTPVPKS